MGCPRNSTTQGISSVALLRTKHRQRRGHADFAVVHVANVKAPRLHASLHVASLNAL